MSTPDPTPRPAPPQRRRKATQAASAPTVPASAATAAAVSNTGAHLVSVWVATPRHGGLGDALSYQSEHALAPGTLLRVPLGAREMLAVVAPRPTTAVSVAPANADSPPPGPVAQIDAEPHTHAPSATATHPADSTAPPRTLRPVAAVLDALNPLSDAWLQLVHTVANYYQRSVGEVALSALPVGLRDLQTTGLARRLARLHKVGPVAPTASPVQSLRAESASSAVIPPQAATKLIASGGLQVPILQAEQAQALAAFDSVWQSPVPPAASLLHGVTGSGKTEVYLQAVATALAQDPQAQALVLVPEINLTPQLQARFEARFAHLLAQHPLAVVSLHSRLTPAQRLQHWLAAHLGLARIVLGTRMAVLASLPQLRLIVVDEEHDPSYKAQDGARHSARDVAVLRAQIESRHAPHAPRCRVLLGSATPSLESWRHSAGAPDDSASAAAPEGTGRYQRLTLAHRIDAVPLPRVRVHDMRREARGTVLAHAVREAIAQRVAAGQQSLLLLNQRGYAPVLSCGDCGWKSDCPHCSAYRAFHKTDRTLRCHHCGLTQPVPRACPSCGNPDIRPVGLGTQRLHEVVQAALADVLRPDGQPLVVARIDADTTRAAGALSTQLAAVHSGHVDVLVGTQMVAKGHDFRRVGLVVALNPDAALFSSDFRAPERLFALLMQAAGRAGRASALAPEDGAAPPPPPECWVQTFEPRHPLYAALMRHDYAGFAATELAARRGATLPPFAHQALLRAEGRTAEATQAFLQAAWAAGQALAPQDAGITLYPPVPMPMARVADVERAQMLVEAVHRPALQRWLGAWHHALLALPQRGLLRWAVDVDPLEI